MDLNITRLANIEKDKSAEFLGKMDSKLMMDVSKNRIIENDEWIDMVEFTIPYLEKALTKQIKNIVTEEEIIKIELIKKVTVESVKHLSKNVNLVDRYNQKSGEVIPKKILNAYKEETYLNYENRFLYTLIKLIEDYMYIREKDQDALYKGKNHQKANYQADIKLKKEKINVNVEYNSELSIGTKKSQEKLDRIKKIKEDLKMLKQTEVYQILQAKRATYVKAPLKMTNVLLKNVNFQYAVKLWNYLSEQMEIKDKSVKESSEFEEKGIVKRLIDEDIFLLHSIFKTNDLNETISSILFKNSGLNVSFKLSNTLLFIAVSLLLNPIELVFKFEPTFEVIMIIVFSKLTVFPWLSVNLPSSKTCNNKLNTSG